MSHRSRLYAGHVLVGVVLVSVVDPDPVALGALPAYARYAEGCRLVGERRFRPLVEAGSIVQIGHGTYRKSSIDADDDLADIMLKSASATICLVSALARHDLSDAIPAAIDIAVPRQSWTPLTRAPVVWHQFDRATFEVGRTALEIAPGLVIGLYSRERSIVDAYRLAHREGSDVAHQALRRWLRRAVNRQPSSRWPHRSPGRCRSCAERWRFCYE